MSFAIYLQYFRNGETATFKRAVFEQIFGRHAIDLDSFPKRVVYADGGAEIYVDADEDIDGVTFNRCGGDTFFAALLELADQTKSVVYWPDEGRQLAVTDPEILPHLPPELAALGPAFIVKSGKELEEAICHQIDPADAKSTDD